MVRALPGDRPMYQNAAILAAFLLIYSTVAGRVERSWLSGPIVFTAAGLLLGPFGLGLVYLNSGLGACAGWRS